MIVAEVFTHVENYDEGDGKCRHNCHVNESQNGLVGIGLKWNKREDKKIKLFPQQ
jgi:hypothetical protein